jgi:hypothetical protein
MFLLYLAFRNNLNGKRLSWVFVIIMFKSKNYFFPVLQERVNHYAYSTAILYRFKKKRVKSIQRINIDTAFFYYVITGIVRNTPIQNSQKI